MSNVIIPDWTLGDRLAKARDVADISVQRMADLLRVTRGTVSNYEHGRTEPPFSTIEAYSRATGVELWWLLGEEPTDPGVTEGYSVDSCVTALLAA